MAAGRYDFTIEQGATLSFTFDYVDANNNPADLTDYQARMQIRPFIGSSTAYITLSSSLGPGGTGINMNGAEGNLPASSGSMGVYISAPSSSRLDWEGSAVYDLEIYSGSGAHEYVVRLIEGKVKLSKEVTTTL